VREMGHVRTSSSLYYLTDSEKSKFNQKLAISIIINSSGYNSKSGRERTPAATSPGVRVYTEGKRCWMARCDRCYAGR